MKYLKKISFSLIIILLMCLALPNLLPQESSMRKVEAASIKLNVKTATMTVGDTLTLKVVGTKKKAIWKSSNKSIATVDSIGTVKALTEGTVKITATVAKKTYSCKVTVESSVNEDIDFTASLIQSKDSETIVALVVIENNSEDDITINADGYVYNSDSQDTSSPVFLFDIEDEEDYEFLDEVVIASGEEVQLWYRNEKATSFWVDEDTLFGFDFSYDDVNYYGFVNTNSELKFAEGTLYKDSNE